MSLYEILWTAGWTALATWSWKVALDCPMRDTYTHARGVRAAFFFTFANLGAIFCWLRLFGVGL